MSPTAAATALETSVVPCPKCGKTMRDVRDGKTNPRGPDFTCRSDQCRDEKGYRTAVWEKDLARLAAKAPAVGRAHPAAVPNAAAPPASSPTSPTSFEALGNLHRRCLAFVVQHEGPLLAATSGDVARAVACCANALFIEVNRRGGAR